MFIPFYVLFYSLKAEDEKFSPLCPHQLLIDPHHLLVDHKAKSSVIAKLTENKFFVCVVVSRHNLEFAILDFEIFWKPSKSRKNADIF